VPISDKNVAYANSLKNLLIDENIDSEVYSKNDSLNKRIRTAEKQRVPYVVIVGDEEEANSSVAVRDRREKEQYNLTKDEFMVKLVQQLKEGKI